VINLLSIAIVQIYWTLHTTPNYSSLQFASNFIRYSLATQYITTTTDIHGENSMLPFGQSE